MAVTGSLNGIDGGKTPQQPPCTASWHAASNLGPDRRRQRRGGRKRVLAAGTEGYHCAPHCSDEKWTETPWTQWCAHLNALLSEEDGENQVRAMFEIRGHVWNLSQDEHGCRIVQNAMKVSILSLQEALAQELQWHVKAAACSPHANHVIQLIVELLPAPNTAFIARELMGSADQIARHRFACRVIIRLIEQSLSESATMQLVDEILMMASDLVKHSMGRHVLQAILEHGTAHQRHIIAEALRHPSVQSDSDVGILGCAKNKHASHLIESTMLYCSEEDKLAICGELVEESRVVQLARNKLGRFSLRAVISVPGSHRQIAQEQLRSCSMELLQYIQETQEGRDILRRLDIHVAT